MSSVFQQERQNIEDLQRALSLAKQKYKATLQSLETISESIHEKRKAKASSQLPLRTPGVGAESIYSQSSDTSDLPSINLGMFTFVAMQGIASTWNTMFLIARLLSEVQHMILYFNLENRNSVHNNNKNANS